ncbi:alpha-amylase, partial [bacterium]
MSELRFRQVHLDFHTSEKIPGIGGRFDKSKFQEALKRGHVDSVTLFSKCHHGLSYHPTKVGQMHPHLSFDLMSRQIEACREIDVKCPIYLSAGYDEWAAFAHPEWLACSREGKSFNPTQPGFKALGFDTPYLDYLCEQIIEVVENFDAADGIFLDIVGPRDNFSPIALTKMHGFGIDIFDDAAVSNWKYQVLQNYFARTTVAVKTGDSKRKVFHNSGHILKGAPEINRWNSHLELESLPTGGWGYDHFPMSAKYAATTGFDFLGMTGKFHTTWGEFGGFKRANALRYECAAMLAFGAKCSIGDQLHPNGEMNLDTYALIGAAYAEVETKEAWCRAAVPISDIALFSPEALIGNSFIGRSKYNQAEEGAARMLLELGAQFDVVDGACDFAKYQLVILPDTVTLTGEFLEKIEKYLENGGKLLLSSASGLNSEKTEFALNLGLELVGKSEFVSDYLVPTAASPTSPVRGPFVVHGGAFN